MPVPTTCCAIQRSMTAKSCSCAHTNPIRQYRRSRKNIRIEAGNIDSTTNSRLPILNHGRAALTIPHTLSSLHGRPCSLPRFPVNTHYPKGLDAAHAHEASHDWLPYTAQPESEEPPPQSDAEGSVGGESFTSATHPTKCAAGERRPERAGENQGRRGSRQESSGPPSPPHSPAAQGSPEPSQTRATHLAEASQVRDGEPVDDPLSLQARRVSPPAALTSPGATLGDSNEGGARAEGAGVSGCGDGDGGDDGGTRPERAATAASLRSARSAGSRGRSPRQHQWRTKHVSNRTPSCLKRPNWFAAAYSRFLQLSCMFHVH